MELSTEMHAFFGNAVTFTSIHDLMHEERANSESSSTVNNRNSANMAIPLHASCTNSFTIELCQNMNANWIKAVNFKIFSYMLLNYEHLPTNSENIVRIPLKYRFLYGYHPAIEIWSKLCISLAHFVIVLKIYSADGTAGDHVA